MSTIIIAAIICATVITSIINFAKPAYKWFAGKFTVTITIALSFILGIVAAYSVAPFLGIELPLWATILVWLALGTGSNIFYDVWKIIKGAGERLKK